jgi:5-hydroxyisourate hydrolase-like protein (transthyretin family)
MEDNATRVMNAATAGQQVMVDNSTLWDTKPAIVNKKTALDNKIEEVEKLDDNITGGSGDTVAKTAARDNAAKAALKLAKPMTVFARDTNNPVLEGEINISWSKLRNGKEQDAIDNWQLVHDRAEANEAALVAGGYTEAAWTTQLDAAITAFKDQRGRPKAKRSDVKAINTQINLRIKELQTIKTDLLDLLTPFKETDPIFYDAVKAAFELDMTGKRHVALRLHFIDEATGIRLPGVQAQIMELALAKTASKNGRIDFTQQELPQGNYSLTFTLQNYVGQSAQNVAVQVGKLNTMEIVMVKTAGGGGSGTTTGTVSGKVRQGGMPVSGATVSVVSNSSSSPATPIATTDASGNYSLNGLATGSVDIRAALPGSSPMPPMTKNITIEAGKTATLNFDF